LEMDPLCSHNPKVVGSNPSPATKLSSIKLVSKARHTVGLFLFGVGQKRDECGLLMHPFYTQNAPENGLLN